jgi:lipopolysaccharide export system protein LptA
MTVHGKSWPGLLAAAALAGVAVCNMALAQAPASVPNAVQGFSKNRDKPVQIEAAQLEVRDKLKIATFIGNVHVVQGDTTLRCKRLVVHYDGGDTPGAMKSATPGPSGQQQISRLEALGGVIVTQLEQTATGDTGLFDMKANTITLLGNVVVSQGKNVVRGDRLVVDMTTGVSRVESGTKGPVRMLIENNPKDDTPLTQKNMKMPLR